MPKWRRPARVLDVDDTGDTARYQSQTFKVARNCVRRRVDEKEVDSNGGPLGLEPNCGRYTPLELDPPGVLPTSETAPDAADKHMVTQKERVNREVAAQENAPEVRMEDGVRQPTSGKSPTEIPDSQRLPI